MLPDGCGFPFFMSVFVRCVYVICFFNKDNNNNDDEE